MAGDQRVPEARTRCILRMNDDRPLEEAATKAKNEDDLSGTGHTDRFRVIALALCVAVVLVLAPKGIPAHSHQTAPAHAGLTHDPLPSAPAEKGHTHHDCGAVICNTALHSNAGSIPAMDISVRLPPVRKSSLPDKAASELEPPVPRS